MLCRCGLAYHRGLASPSARLVCGFVRYGSPSAVVTRSALNLFLSVSLPLSSVVEVLLAAVAAVPLPCSGPVPLTRLNPSPAIRSDPNPCVVLAVDSSPSPNRPMEELVRVAVVAVKVLGFTIRPNGLLGLVLAP
jgi:hypothetical protein